MRLSNKLTFSLVCFIVLLAFVVTPAMAHDLNPNADTNPHNISGNSEPDADHKTHPILDKIELLGVAADGYVNNGQSFSVKITFSGAAPLDLSLDDDISIPNNWLKTNLTSTGSVWTFGVTAPLTGTLSDGVIRITSDATVNVTDTNETNNQREATIYDPEPADGSNLTNAEKGRRPSIVLDNTAPQLPTTGNSGAPTISGERSITDLQADQWSGSFNVEFNITDSTTDLSIDLGTIKLTADPDVFTFSSNVRALTTTDRFAVMATPKPNPSTTAETTKTAVTITISVTDKANNKGTTSVTVNLAPRAGKVPADPTFTSATPASGNVNQGGTISVVFSADPGTVTITGGTISTSGSTRTITVSSTQAAGALTITLSWGTSGSKTLNYTITIPAASDLNVSPDITIPAGKFVVVVRSKTGGIGALLTAYDPNITLATWPTMPDLYDTFDTSAIHGGGALILKQSGDSSASGYVALNPGTVGISEINSAIDESNLASAALRKADQWIELHNLNTTAATVKLSWMTGAKAIAADTSINGNLDRPYLDVVTNVFNNRPGNAHWVLPSSNGNPPTGANFVSAARKGNFSLTNKHDGKFNQRYTNSDKHENASNSPDGRNKDQWAASAVPYARRAYNLGVGLGSIVYENHGTPGRVNTFKPQRADTTEKRTDVKIETVIFNEIANRSNEAYEWIELRNISDGPIHLRNYLISIVENKPKNADRDKADNDRIFYQFPSDKAYTVEKDGVFLLVASDPRGNPDHPLKVGYNVDLDDEDQLIGSRKNPVHYKVMRKSDQAAYQYEGTGLPDHGEFILILRRPDNHEGHRSGADGGKGVAERGKDDLDKVVDVAGFHPNSGNFADDQNNLRVNNYPNVVSSTNLWPLRNFEALDFNRNKFELNKVHYRANNSTRGSHNDHRAAWQDAGYTGIGYKLQASDSAAHGGSPGYHANTLGKAADLADGKVFISEIMLSQGTRGNLPQWIELYNPSKTHAVNLADNAGWRLVIEPPDRAPIITINFKNKGNVKHIQPNSTVLIVSGSARDYGSDTLPRGTVFPNTRVLNAFQAIRGELFELESRTSPLLSPNGFNIRLLDGKTTNNKPDGRYAGEISDEIGNLDGNPRTNDKAAWEFPGGMTDDGHRTSLIRKHDDAGMPLDGMMAESWVRASDTGGFAQLFVRHTWFGDETDYGTPADRTGSVLPVSLSHFRPALENGEVVIRWTTESELDNAGFNILRSDTRNGEYKQVNTEMIQGNGTTGERNTYKWVDASAKPGVVYYYQIEDVSFAGERQTLQTTKLKGYISAVGKATTTWGDIKEVQ